MDLVLSVLSVRAVLESSPGDLLYHFGINVVGFRRAFPSILRSCRASRRIEMHSAFQTQRLIHFLMACALPGAPKVCVGSLFCVGVFRTPQTAKDYSFNYFAMRSEVQN